MSTFSGSPQVLKGGIVLIDSDSGVVQRIIVLQHNPELTGARAAGAIHGGLRA